MGTKKDLLKYIEDISDNISNMAMEMWNNPELGFKEEYAVQLQLNLLKDKDVKVVKNIGDIPTAFYVEYGSGYPIIGILGEFDALPNMSQSVNIIKEETVESGVGHGCGHNLLGCAGVGIFLTIKEVIKSNKLEGTIRYYGCPGEENLSGKSFMARDGVFNDLDLAITWHPHFVNGSLNASTIAYTTVEFEFEGISAHAAVSPHIGRSALDAVELMNVGSNYLREHVIDQARIHYIITNGGNAVNIVPKEAKVLYGIRAPKKSQVDSILERVINISKGAAMMTDTKVKHKVKSIYYDYLPNETLNQIIYENMCEVEETKFNEEELEFIEGLYNTLDKDVVHQTLNALGIDKSKIKNKMYMGNQVLGRKGVSIPGTTDVGDVSYIVPTGQFVSACAPIGVDAHTWQSTSSYGSSIGIKGMEHAMKTMAFTIYSLLTDKKDSIDKIKEEFNCDRTIKYNPIPEYIKPEINID